MLGLAAAADSATGATEAAMAATTIRPVVACIRISWRNRLDQTLGWINAEVQRGNGWKAKKRPRGSCCQQRFSHTRRFRLLFCRHSIPSSLQLLPGLGA